MVNGDGIENGPRFILRPGDNTASKDFLKNPETLHRKVFRQQVRAGTMSKLDVLQNLNLPEGDQDRVEAEYIYDNTARLKVSNPTLSLFTLINEQLKPYLDDPDAKSKLIVNKLLVARAVITDAARQEGIWRKTAGKLLAAQGSEDWETLEKNMERIYEEEETLEKEATKIGEAENAVPFYDFGGVIEQYVYIAQQETKYAMLQEKGEEETPEAERIKREIDLLGWGAPPPGLREKAQRYLAAEKKKADAVATEAQQAEQVGLPEQAVGQGGRTEQLLERLVALSKLSADYQMESVELMRRGYTGVVQAERTRAPLNPTQFDQNPPPWFEELGSEEQGMIRTRLHINYLAATKRDNGMMDFDAVIGLRGIRIEREDVTNMWEKMPGFREVVATMIHDIFEEGKDHLVISEEGYRIMGDVSEFEKYRKELVGKIQAYLEPRRAELLGRYLGVNMNDLATAAVSSVDNLFFATGVYDSADEKTGIPSGASNMYSEQIRSFSLPRLRGVVKWPKRAWGGKLGEWMRDNIAKNRKGFRDRFERGEVGYVPERLFYSLLDHTNFSDDADRSVKDKSLASVLLEKQKEQIADGLWDYKGGAEAINLRNLKPDELYGAYADIRWDVSRIYKHLLGLDPKKDRLTTSDLADVLDKVRGDPLLKKKKIFYNEEFITAAIALAKGSDGIMAEGFEVGIPEIVLMLDPRVSYDNHVADLMAESRLFEGMGRGFRRRFRDKLNAENIDTIIGASKSDKSDEIGILSRGKRARLRKRAQINRNK